MIQIINSKGQVIQEANQKMTEGINRVELSLNEIPKGIYFVAIKGEKTAEQIVRKL